MTDDNQQHALEDLKEIRAMMERSSRFISLSGLSGISAGIIAIIGAFIGGWYINKNIDYVEGNIARENVRTEDVVFLLLLAGVILFLAIGAAIYFAIRKARLNNLPIWNKAAELTLVNLLLPLGTGAIFCLILFTYGLYILIAPATLVFYGLALLNASKFTLSEIRYLGVSEIVLGLIAMVIPGYSILFWALGFGLLHIVYGAVMYFRYER
ncbi:MAG TPA: hypothetical protein PLL28_09310 [Chitinophagales bacterium]|nr:hypothetical protein [Chitinophagales bacterium]HMX05310.1 hypothetical protein [Chitinophagales bacterium]HMZ89360.1 hypothetical protein [Chitinophagales bacterium]HNF69560.1 hypothetical protein [Chitinophagales bacterium]HNJ89308.1 hypothetical protein [Chitinophagales bacterium]